MKIQSMLDKQKHRSFIAGVLYACQELAEGYDEPSYAEWIMQSSGFTKREFVTAQKSSDSFNDKMWPIIHAAFKDDSPEDIETFEESIEGMTKRQMIDYAYKHAPSAKVTMRMPKYAINIHMCDAYKLLLEG